MNVRIKNRNIKMTEEQYQSIVKVGIEQNINDISDVLKHMGLI